MSSGMYDKGRLEIAKGNVTWGGAGTYKVLLVDETYVFNSAHDFVDDVAAKEVSGTGYTRKTLANLVAAVVANKAECSADNPVWTGLALGSEKAAGVVVFKQVTNDADSFLICFIDVADLDTIGVDTTLKFNGQATSGPVYRV
jgi:hypothetical protein